MGYLEEQQSRFKIGDRVKIVRKKPASREEGWMNSWNSKGEMDKYIGDDRVYTVKDNSSNDGIRLLETPFSWPYQSLELYTQDESLEVLKKHPIYKRYYEINGQIREMIKDVINITKNKNKTI